MDASQVGRRTGFGDQSYPGKSLADVVVLLRRLRLCCRIWSCGSCCHTPETFLHFFWFSPRRFKIGLRLDIAVCLVRFFHSFMITSCIDECGFTVEVMLCLAERRMLRVVWRVSPVGLRVLRRISCAHLWNLRQGSRLQHFELDSTRSVRVGMKRYTQKHESPSKLQFSPHTSANASSITRALCSPWPQRGVEFVARECCKHNCTIAARDLTWAHRTKV